MQADARPCERPADIHHKSLIKCNTMFLPLIILSSSAHINQRIFLNELFQTEPSLPPPHHHLSIHPDHHLQILTIRCQKIKLKQSVDIKYYRVDYGAIPHASTAPLPWGAHRGLQHGIQEQSGPKDSGCESNSFLQTMRLPSTKLTSTSTIQHGGCCAWDLHSWNHSDTAVVGGSGIMMRITLYRRKATMGIRNSSIMRYV